MPILAVKAAFWLGGLFLGWKVLETGAEIFEDARQMAYVGAGIFVLWIVWQKVLK